MLKVAGNRHIGPVDAYTDASSHLQVKSSSLSSVLRRNRVLTFGIVLVSTAIGLIYALTSTPMFTSSSDILIDARRVHGDTASAGNRSLAELGMDNASIDSQVAVLSSEGIATGVMRRLHLDHDASFAAPTTLPGRLLMDLRHALGRDAVDDHKSGIPSDILEGFMRNLQVKRVQQTYVISLSFTDRTPERAAAIVNAFTDVYQSEQIRSDAESKDRSSAWLKGRIAAVRQEIAAADQAMRSFRAEIGEGLGGAAAAASSPEAALASNDAQLKLHKLERDLDNKKTLYEALLDKANASIQQQSLPVSSVSVLSAGRLPRRRSQPNIPLIVALSALAGLAAAAGFATFRELTHTTFRLPSDVDATLRMKCIGLVPKLSGGTMRRAVARSGSRSLAQLWRARSRLSTLVHGSGPRLSLFAEALRAVKVISHVGTHRNELSVIGVVSALAGEGRSTIAANLADMLGEAGRRVLLIDADLRCPTLSGAYTPQRQSGLLEVIGRVADLDASVEPCPDTCVDFLPSSGGAAGGMALLDLAGFQYLLACLGESYDTVVLDLPPLSSFTEVVSVVPLIDEFLLVVAWGDTCQDVVIEALQTVPLVYERTIGAVLNKVNVRAARRMSSSSKDTFFFAGADRPRPA